MKATLALPIFALTLTLVSPAHAATVETLECRSPGMTPPVPLTSHVAGLEDYPPLSRALGEHGDTQVKYVVLASGDVGDVTLVKSSGSLRLDDATTTFVKGFKFKPALLAGAAVACSNQIVLRWALNGGGDIDNMRRLMAVALYPTESDFPPGAFAQHETGDALGAIYLNANGGTNMVALMRGTQFQDLNAATVELLRKQKVTPATMDGKPVVSVLFVLVSWSTTGKPPPPQRPDASPPPDEGDQPQARP
jgi:TonB family protein